MGAAGRTVGGHVRGATLGAVVGARRARATRGEEEEDLRSVHQLGQERCRARRRRRASPRGFPEGRLGLTARRLSSSLLIFDRSSSSSSASRSSTDPAANAVARLRVSVLRRRGGAQFQATRPGVYVADPGPRAGDGHAPARRTGFGADPPREDGDRNRHDAVGAR